MNELLEKLRNILGATLGKVLLIVFGGSFLLTLLLAIVQGNKILVSFSRALVSAFCIVVVLYIIYFILIKILGDIISDTTKSNNNFTMDTSSIEEFAKDNLSSDEEDSSNTDNNKSFQKPLDIVSGQIIDDKNSTEESDDVKKDYDEDVMASPFETKPSPPISSKTIDKKSKMSYDNKSGMGFADFSSSDTGDIGSIIFSDKVKDAVSSDSKKSKNNAPAKTDSNDGFIDFSKAAKSNPDIMAKAVRSMRSRDKE